MASGMLIHRAVARHGPLIRQFLRFGTVGFAGFLIDNATVYGTRSVLGLYGAGLLSFFVAATFTWAMNRIWTFRGLGADGSLWRQWLLFLGANATGFLLNRGTYAILVTVSPLCARQPVFAIFGGTLAGLGANFHLSRKLVFRARPPVA